MQDKKDAQSSADEAWVVGFILNCGGEVSYPGLQRHFRSKFGFHEIVRLNVVMDRLEREGRITTRIGDWSILTDEQMDDSAHWFFFDKKSATYVACVKEAIGA